MTPNAYMLTGLICGIIIAIMSIFVSDAMFVTMGWACGCLFGKGYGIQEESGRI